MSELKEKIDQLKIEIGATKSQIENFEIDPDDFKVNLKHKYDFFNSSKKENMKKAGYKYMKYTGYKTHILQDLETGENEVWVANKNHASYGIVYKNTHLEFMNSLPINWKYL
jgi:hypothetical protein